jgi:hypothetical protein
MELPPDGTPEPCREPGCDEMARFSRHVDDTRARGTDLSSQELMPPRPGSRPGWKCPHGHIRFMSE